jgi:hypothetical protein
VSNAKIVSMVDAAYRKQADVFNADIAALITALDDMLMPLEAQIEELKQRVKKLEGL